MKTKEQLMELGVLSDEVVTYTGKIFRPLHPDPSLIDIDDIAHALSNQCRFTGHTKKFYSVAQHSVLATELVDHENKMTALLHDASEAFLSDIARPIKAQSGLGDIYREIEDRLMVAIAERFDIKWPMPEQVKWADDVMLRSEQKELMPDLLRWVGDDYFPRKIYPWNPTEAKVLFMSKYNELKGER